MALQKIQTQGVHHITLTGADRQTSIDFWEGILGMPFVFEQPNLDNEDESHLYFDPGDGRLITVFTKEDRESTPDRTPTDPGCVHHLAFNVSQATWRQAEERLKERGIEPALRDRGFMDSMYFTAPMGLLIEDAAHRVRPAPASRPPTASPTPKCRWRRTGSGPSAATTRSTRSTWPTRSRR